MRESECYGRGSFRVRARTFTRSVPGEYTDGKIVVYCDQQCSTAWAAKLGDLRTGYYSAPEFAVAKLLDSVAAAARDAS
jgi:hypothetical protein